MIKLQIWDTAGQERFRTITTSYYRGAHMIFMCYDITDRQSFQNLEMWLQEVHKYASLGARIVICGTKIDLGSKREVSYEEANLYANKHGYDFYETSAKDNKNVDELFEKSSENMLEKFLVELKNTELSVANIYKKTHSLQNTISLNRMSLTDNILKKCCM